MANSHVCWSTPLKSTLLDCSSPFSCWPTQAKFPFLDVDKWTPQVNAPILKWLNSSNHLGVASHLFSNGWTVRTTWGLRPSSQWPISVLHNITPYIYILYNMYCLLYVYIYMEYPSYVWERVKISSRDRRNLGLSDFDPSGPPRPPSQAYSHGNVRSRRRARGTADGARMGERLWERHGGWSRGFSRCRIGDILEQNLVGCLNMGGYSPQFPGHFK